MFPLDEIHMKENSVGFPLASVCISCQHSQSYKKQISIINQKAVAGEW